MRVKEKTSRRQTAAGWNAELRLVGLAAARLHVRVLGRKLELRLAVLILSSQVLWNGEPDS